MKFKCSGYLSIQQHTVYLDEKPRPMHLIDIEGVYEFTYFGVSGSRHVPERVDGPVLVKPDGGESYYYSKSLKNKKARKFFCLEVESDGKVILYLRQPDGLFKKGKKL